MPYLTLKEKTVEDFTYQYIEKSDAVACLVTTHIKGNLVVLITNQFRIGPFVMKGHPVFSEIPAGNIDINQSLFTEVVRELQEETGLTIKSHNINYLGVIYSSPGWTTERIFLFHTHIEDYTKVKNIAGNEKEHEKIFNSWIPIHQIGLLMDSKLFSAVYLAREKHLI